MSERKREINEKRVEQKKAERKRIRKVNQEKKKVRKGFLVRLRKT